MGAQHILPSPSRALGDAMWFMLSLLQVLGKVPSSSGPKRGSATKPAAEPSRELRPSGSHLREEATFSALGTDSRVEHGAVSLRVYLLEELALK